MRMWIEMEYPSRVISVIPHGTHSVSVRFEIPPGFSYLPGQYMFITIGSGEASLVKHLTISSSPTEPDLQVTKKLTGHPYSNALAGLAPGDKVILRGPYGEFTFTGEYPKVAFISGGIGVTALRSMMRYAADRNLSGDIILLYSVKTEDEILFREDFEDFSVRNPNQKIVVTLTHPGPGWMGHTGRIDRTFIEKEIPDWKERVFFTCGPSAMVDMTSSLLREMGALSNHIRTEYFPGF
jgi:glycine betaine catabolism B